MTYTLPKNALEMRPVVAPRTGRGVCNGTFGELLQGALPEPSGSFMVTLPTAVFSTATFEPFPNSSEVKIYPAYKQKSRRLAEAILKLFGLPPGGILQIISGIPEGKGCAGSSADLVATARAIEDVFGITIAPETLSRLMVEIEPSDGVMYRGVVSYHHREGRLRNFIGPLKPLVILAVDQGGQVDTLEYNRRLVPYSETEREIYAGLLVELEKAVRRGDIKEVGRIATRSAVLNQSRLPKKHLALLLHLRERYQTPGVVVAHSGTYAGLLLDPSAPEFARVFPALKTALIAAGLQPEIFNTLP